MMYFPQPWKKSLKPEQLGFTIQLNYHVPADQAGEPEVPFVSGCPGVLAPWGC